ncbi:hypothetical protein [Draconibacterium orientale]|uniref:hypothetical protein n=1 Tax=Draconibacterium orientale TaxID=1168034 RepID=UPI002ABD5EF9|nr:hypothetical protein [Draconibacterium orientale]
MNIVHLLMNYVHVKKTDYAEFAGKVKMMQTSTSTSLDPIGLTTAGIGLASSIYGGIKSAKANKEAEKQLDAYEAKQEAFYDKRLNQDFMESNAAKGLVEQMRKRYQNQAKTIESKGEATGATAEATIAAKSEANEQYNNSMNNLAQKSTYYQLNNEQGYQNSLADMYSKRMALNRNKAQNAANLAGTGAQLIGTGADVLAMELSSAKSEKP